MKWPKELILIRHGQSEFNILTAKKEPDPEYQEFKERYKSEAKNDFQFSERTVQLALIMQKRYNLSTSDSKTQLTEFGKEQSEKTGIGLAQNYELPDVIFVSPYVRTLQTLEEIVKGWPELKKVRVIEDERIRERNIGLLELYNDWRVLNVLKPVQGRLRQRQGGFYFQYPQGESIVDVRSRNRQWSQTLTRDWSEKKVLVVSHHLTILSIRSLYERWDEEKFLWQDENDVPKNCSLTVYRGDPNQGDDGKLILEEYNKIFY